MASIAAPVAAQGNVAVLTDGQGNLRLIGDAEGNRVVVMEEHGTHQLVLRGQNGTTVNHQPEIRPFFQGTRVHIDLRGGNDLVRFGLVEEGSCCAFEVVFIGGEGDDTFRIGDEEAFLLRAFVDLGPGNDRFEGGEDGGVQELFLECGDGNDVVRGFAFHLGGGEIDLGMGDDELDIGLLFSSAPIVVTCGPGADEIELESLFLEAAMLVSTGEGDDIVEVTDFRQEDGGPFVLETEAGADRVFLSEDAGLLGGITLNTGDDADVLVLDAVRVPLSLGANLGTGDDVLRIAGSSFSGGSVPVFDGAEGIDRWLDLGANHFDLAPDVLRFEGPFTRRQPTSPTASTVIAGRVIGPDAAPVPGAVVTVAELGVTTTSDGDGHFVFPELTIAPMRLALTAGATIRGRRMAARVAFRSQIDETTEIGDVAVEPTRALALVFGDAPETEQVAAQLAALGGGPLDVSVEHFLPADLTPFEVVWNVARITPLLAAESDRLAAFVRSGGGLYLAGDSTVAQSAHETLVNALILDPDVDVVPQSGDWFPIAYHAGAPGGLSRWPNALELVSDFVGGRQLTGVQLENAFILGLEGQVFAAAWDGLDLVGGRGRVGFGLNTLWPRATGNLLPLENLRAFLRWEPDAFPVR